MQIYVGSTNPVKINSVLNAASETWPEVQVKGFSTQSGVPEQPIGDQITKQGAKNRAQAVLEIARAEGFISGAAWQAHEVRADIGQKISAEIKQSVSAVTPNTGGDFLGVGLEGGVFYDQDEIMWTTVWACVTDLSGQMFFANGARFLVPEIIAAHIRAGAEMGPIVAKLVGEEDVRSKQGMIGIITEGFVDRTEEYAGLVKMALGLWYGREWEKKL